MKLKIICFLMIFSVEILYSMDHTVSEHIYSSGWIVGDNIPCTFPSYFSLFITKGRNDKEVIPSACHGTLIKKITDCPDALSCSISLGKPEENAVLYVHHLSFPDIDNPQESFVLFQKRLESAIELLHSKYSCNIITIQNPFYIFNQEPFFLSLFRAEQSVSQLKMLKACKEYSLSEKPSNLTKIEFRFIEYYSIVDNENNKEERLGDSFEQDRRYLFHNCTDISENKALCDEVRRVNAVLKLNILLANRLRNGKLFPFIPEGPRNSIEEYYMPDSLFLYECASRRILPEEKKALKHQKKPYCPIS